MTHTTRLLAALLVALAVTLLAASVAVYPDLPARIPSHFGADGVADGFSRRESWFTLPAIAVVTAVLHVGLAWALPRWPGLLNTPRKAEIALLPREAQTAIAQRALPGLMAIGVLVMVTFLGIQYASWAHLQGSSTRWLSTALIIVPIGCVALLPAILLPVDRELDRQQALRR